MGDHIEGLHPGPLVYPDNPELDATDWAHPAWWRGNDRGVEATCEMLHAIIDGKYPQGTVGYEPLERLRWRIQGLLEQQAM